MYNRNNNGTIDLLFTLLLVFLIITGLLLMLPKKPMEADGKVEPKAEYIVFMDWSDKMDTDVDMWAQVPIKDGSDVIYFKKKTGPGIRLERDDQGNKTDRIGTKKVLINQEIMTIRGTTPGTYTFNGHIYSTMSAIEEPLEVSIKIIKLNPFRIVYQGIQSFSNIDEEKTFVSFEIDENGNFSNLTFDQFPLVRKGLR